MSPQPPPNPQRIAHQPLLQQSVSTASNENSAQNGKENNKVLEAQNGEDEQEICHSAQAVLADEGEVFRDVNPLRCRSAEMAPAQTLSPTVSFANTVTDPTSSSVVVNVPPPQQQPQKPILEAAQCSMTSGWEPLGGTANATERITEFLFSISAADESPIPIAQDVLQHSNLSAHGFDQKSDSDVSNAAGHSKTSDGGFDKSVYKAKDWSILANTSAKVLDESAATSVFRASSKEFHPRPWLLLFAFLRIKKFVMSWKARRAENNPKSNDPLAILLDQLESHDWVFVYKVNWLENSSSSSPTTFNIPPVPPTTNPNSGLGAERRSFSRSRRVAAYLHLSTSHFYLRRDSIEYDERVLIRLSDIHRIEPFNGALEISYQLPYAEVSEPSSTTVNEGVGNWNPATRSRISSAMRRKSSAAIVSPMPSPTLQNHTKKTIIISGDENHVIALQVLDLQSRMLRHLSSGLSQNLRTKSLIKELTIVHFNDVYHLPPFKSQDARGIVGGVSRFHTVLSKLRESQNPLVLFSGDFMGPSLMSVITKGKQMVDAFNFLGVNYGVFGNHEFDFGLKTLKEVIHGYTQGKHVYSGSQTVWLMSNMVESDGTPLGGAQQFAICTWNNVKIGLLGLCENWLPQCSNLLPTEAMYLDIFDRGEELAQMLKDEHECEIVIALTHNRYPVDRELSTRCPSIDYILGGHDHKAKNDPKHRITKSGQEFEYLTLMECTIAPETKPKFKIDLIPITFELPESDFMKGLIERYEIKMAEKLGRAIGMTDVELDSTEETVRFKEGALTNFILDVIQDGMETEIAFLGAAAIAGKDIKPPGNVTLGDVFAWFPNETKVMTMRLLGSTILKTLTVMVREIPAEAPSFPHPSSQLHFTINVFKKPPVVENVSINGEPLDPERWYLCAVEDFVGMGKAKYKHVAAEGEVVVGEDDAVQVATLVRDFFVKKKGFGRQNAEESVQKLSSILNVTKVVSSATHIGVDTDTAKSQRFIRAMICELLGCDRSSIFLLDHATQQLHFIPEGGTEIRFPVSVGLSGYVATEQKSINILDVYDDPRFNKAVDLKTGYRTKTMLACPIVLDGVHCDAVVQAINKNDDGVFSEGDELLLRLLGEQVGYQLRNQQLYASAKAALEDRPQVLQVLRSIASDVSIEKMQMMKSLAAYACDAVGCEGAVIYCYDEEANTISYMEDGLDDESVIVSTQLVEKTLLALVKEKLVPITVRDASRISIFKENVATSSRNALATPMITASGDLVGITVFNDKPRGFVPLDEIIAKHFGQFAAVAVENTLRLTKLLLVSTDTALPVVPVAPLNRITTKGGWSTIRAFIARLRRQPKDKHRLLIEFTEKLMSVSVTETLSASASKIRKKTLTEYLSAALDVHRKEKSLPEDFAAFSGGGLTALQGCPSVPTFGTFGGAVSDDDEDPGDAFDASPHHHGDEDCGDGAGGMREDEIMNQIAVRQSSRLYINSHARGTFTSSRVPGAAIPPILKKSSVDMSKRRKSIS